MRARSLNQSCSLWRRFSSINAQTGAQHGAEHTWCNSNRGQLCLKGNVPLQFGIDVSESPTPGAALYSETAPGGKKFHHTAVQPCFRRNAVEFPTRAEYVLDWTADELGTSGYNENVRIQRDARDPKITCCAVKDKVRITCCPEGG